MNKVLFCDSENGQYILPMTLAIKQLHLSGFWALGFFDHKHWNIAYIHFIAVSRSRDPGPFAQSNYWSKYVARLRSSRS